MIRRFTLIALLFTFFSSTDSFAQWSFSTGAGYTLYIGDLVDIPKKPGFALNSEIWYDFSERWGLKIGSSIYSLAADDINKVRNRSFKSTNLEGYVTLKYTYIKPNFHYRRFTRRKKLSWKPFWYMGLGWTTLDPAGKTSNSSVLYNLIKTKPEGKEISRIAITIPAGFGIKVDLNEQYALVFDGGIRYALSDFLDGVGTRFIDRSSLSSLALDYYNNISGGEVLGGNPGLNDIYWLWTTKIQYTPVHHGRRSKYRRKSSFPKYGYKRRR